MAKQGKQTFVRDATGLLRDLTALDAFIIAVGISNIPYGGAAGYGFFGFLYPGADPAFTFLGALVPGLLIAVVYVYFAAAMPRSGGDYVFLSRTVNPWYGFIMNFSIVLNMIFSIGLDSFYLSTQMFAPGFGAMGFSLQNQDIINFATQFTNVNIAFGIGVIIILIMTAILALRIKIISQVNRVLFIISMIGTIVVFGLLAANSNATFIASFNQKLSGIATYNGIIQTAQQNGWQSVRPVLFATMLASAPAFVFLGEGPTFPVYVGGEIKSAKKTIPLALIGGFLFAGVMDWLGGELLMNTVGYDFLGAAGYLFFGTSKYPLSIPPWINFYAGLLTNNVVLLLIIAVYMGLAMVLNMLAFLVCASRSMFSWAFDRVVPEIFAKVSERTVSPVWVAVASGIASLIALYLAAYTPILSFFLNITIWFAADLLLVALAGIIFPYRRKDLYETSIWKVNIAKIPLVSLLSVVASAFLLFLMYAASVTPALGPTSPGSYAIIIGSFVVPLVIYWVSKYYRRVKDGVDLSMLYKTIPPE